MDLSAWIASITCCVMVLIMASGEFVSTVCADAPALANENSAANSGIRNNFFISNWASKIVQALERTLTREFDGNPCANCESRIDLLRLRAQRNLKEGKLNRLGGTSWPAGICVVSGP